MVLMLLFLVFVVNGDRLCERDPSDFTRKPKGQGNNGFRVTPIIMKSESGVPEKAEGYIPGEAYNIVINGIQTDYTQQIFKGFNLVASDGTFEIEDNIMDSRVSHRCENMVEQTNYQSKTTVAIKWRAPNEDNGCIKFRAMVVVNQDRWYIDDGTLTTELCPLIGYENFIPDDRAIKCCACDEAKYEMILTGLWSKHTHPKDFPHMLQLTHFSDIVGASHSKRFTMWQIGAYATDGLKELAEWGNTYKMEQEMKEHAPEIRTIIKTRGLWYPNVLETTKAMFRVDKSHHFVSMASMLGPSPDWCVGISSVNLCTPDCSWINERKYDLYLWDAGTDSGVTYMSPNNPTTPREKITEITTKNPSDHRSPFFNIHSEKMLPFARLTLNKLKTYHVDCNATSPSLNPSIESSADAARRECMTRDWTPWSLCSATCGKGIRMRSRVYKFPIKAQMFNCDRQIVEKQFCNAAMPICTDSDAFNDECAVKSWTEWSDCSVTCGQGQVTRQRTFFRQGQDSEHRQRECRVALSESRRCQGSEGVDCSTPRDPLCRTTLWSDWSPCSASCGRGMTVRTRQLFYPEHQDRCSRYSTMEKKGCQLEDCMKFYRTRSEEICREPKEQGQCGGVFPRYFYDHEHKTCRRFIFSGCKGNRNQFETEEQCKMACDENYQEEDQILVPANQLAAELGLSHQAQINDGGQAIDCMVTEWTPWSDCSVSCGHGRRDRTRAVKVFPRNNGLQCPTSMRQRRRCQMRPCRRPIRCRVTPWSSWSPCGGATCGSRGETMRRRSLLI